MDCLPAQWFRDAARSIVHGAGGAYTRWAAILPALEKRFRVYAIDRRGRGESGEGDQYAIECEFEDVAAVVDSSVRDIYNRKRGFEQVPTWRLYREMLSGSVVARLRFQHSRYFFQGAQDEVTETSLVQEYFDKVSAPHKELVLFEGAGHFAVWTMPDRFLQPAGESRASDGGAGTDLGNESPTEPVLGYSVDSFHTIAIDIGRPCSIEALSAMR